MVARVIEPVLDRGLSQHCTICYTCRVPPGGEDQRQRSTEPPASQQQSVGSIHFGSGSDNRVILQINSSGEPGRQQSVASDEDPGDGLPYTPSPEESLPKGWKWFFAICTGLITVNHKPRRPPINCKIQPGKRQVIVDRG